MNVVMVAVNDPAGTAIQFARALNRHTEHTCRLVTTELRYNFLFDKDLHVPWLTSFDELEAVLSSADLFHFHMTADEETPLGPFRVRDFLRDRTIVHHHHGEPPFREDPRSFAEREISLGRRALVSTPDLLRGYPEAEWLPNPVPLDHETLLPKEEYNHRYEIIVGQSPTRIDLKNTDLFERVVARIAGDNPRIRLRVIRNTLHRECLALKRDCDMVFDHMQGYFGVSSLESLALGLPTLAGLDRWNLRHVRDFTGTEDHPWVIVRTEEELEARIREFAGDYPLREATGTAARSWMERHWNERIIARRLDGFYREATS